MVDLRIENETAIVSLNRPEKRNALSPGLIREFIDIFRSCETDSSVKSIIVTGSGKAFSAGADLAYLQQLQNNSILENDKDSELISGMIITVYVCYKLVVAAVNGSAIAGGGGLVTACDCIIADRTKFIFGYCEVKI